MKLTKANEAMAKRYEGTEPKFLGNLHERMKYTMALAEQVMPQDASRSETHRDLWNALLDLQVEVQFYEPAKPPYGARAMRSPFNR